MINLHLFSTPGENDLRYVTEASKSVLENKHDPVVAYLPLASLFAEKWHVANRAAFNGLARLEEINAELMTQKEIETILREASLVYITSGNTFLLNHRLHVSGIMPYLKKKIQSGLPMIGVSAGMVTCGPNVLTSRDMNTVGTPHFDGLAASPFNFFAHYEDDPFQDDWLADYHFFHDNPVILLRDGACVKVEGKKTALVRGEAWVLRKGSEKEKVEAGETTVP